MEERCRETGDQQDQRQGAAERVEVRPLRRDELDAGIELPGEQGQEQPLTGTDQGREEDDGEGGMHWSRFEWLGSGC
jgi:hypothetical protein